MDIKTLFLFISISGICVLSLSVLVYWKYSRLIKGSLWWLGAILSISGAAILFSLGGVLPTSLNIHLANSLLLLCPTLMSVSFRQLYGLGPARLSLSLYAVSFLVFNAAAPFTSVNDRIILFSVLFGTLWLEPIFLTLRRQNRRSEGLLGMAFLFASLTAFLRAAGTFLFEKELNSLLEGGPLQQIYIIAMGLELFFFLAGYILMLNSRNLDRVQAAEETLRAAIDHSPYAMVTTDPSGQVISVNRAFEKITGYVLPEIQRAGLQVLQPGDGDHVFSGPFWSALRDGHEWEEEIQSKHLDGSLFWGRSAWSPVRTKNGRVTGFFGVTADITEKRHLEDFKQEIENLMRHDLKTPLNAIIILPDLIESEGPLTPQQKELIQDLRDSGESMLGQINSSLQMYRLEEGTYRPEPESADLSALLATACKLLRPFADAQQVTINCRFAEPQRAGGGPWFSTDKPLFFRLLGNLLKNAVEASPKKGVVDLLVSPWNAGVRLELHNTGAIPHEARARFFAKFNTAGKSQGSGLGAYGAKLIADLLGYSLTFETSNDTGTTLTIGIPCQENRKEREAGAATALPLHFAGNA